MKRRMLYGREGKGSGSLARLRYHVSRLTSDRVSLAKRSRNEQMMGTVVTGGMERGLGAL